MSSWLRLSRDFCGLDNIEIGLSADFPAEFIFVRIGVWPGGSELSGDLTKNGREFMATEQRTDPQGSFDFLLEIDGTVRASFQEVSGLDFEVDVIEYREGGSDDPSGNIKYSKITLKRGVTDDPELWNWHYRWLTEDGAEKRKNGSIVLLDRTSQEIARWNFTGAWPVKWTGSNFNAKGAEVAIESLEIAHERIERA
jgi:phage tail-like protein